MRTKTLVFATRLAIATTRGRPTTPTNGTQSIKLAAAYPSKECRRGITTGRVSAVITHQEPAMAAAIADGAGQATQMRSGSHRRQCAVASQWMKPGPTVIHVTSSTIWTVEPIAQVVFGRGQAQKTGGLQGLPAGARKEPSRRLSGEMTAPLSMRISVERTAASAAGRGKPQTQPVRMARLPNVDAKTGGENEAKNHQLRGKNLSRRNISYYNFYFKFS